MDTCASLATRTAMLPAVSDDKRRLLDHRPARDRRQQAQLEPMPSRRVSQPPKISSHPPIFTARLLWGVVERGRGPPIFPPGTPSRPVSGWSAAAAPEGARGPARAAAAADR